MDPWIVTVPHLKAYLNGRAYDPDNHGLFIADGDHTYYMVESEENDNKIAFVFHDRKFEIPGHTALIISAKEALGDDDPDLLIKRLFNLSRDKLINQETLHDGVFTKIKDRTTSHVAATIMGVGIKETNPVTYILEPIVPEGFGYKATNALRITTDNLAPLVTPEKVKVRGRIAIPRDLGIFIQAVDQIEVGGLDLAYIYGEKNTEGNITLIVDGKETKVRTPFLLLKRNQLEKTIRELSENHELLNAIHQNCDIFRRTLAEKQYNGLDFFMAAMILLRETNGAYPWNSKQLKKWAERAAQTSEVHIERLKGVKDGKYMKKEVAKPIQEAIEFLQEDRKKLIEVIYANIAN